MNPIGFSVTKKIYKTSNINAENEEFNLNYYKRQKPLSKLKTTKEIINDIIEHIKECSIESENIRYKNQVFYL